PPLIPSHEVTNNPRLVAQGIVTQRPPESQIPELQIPQPNLQAVQISPETIQHYNMLNNSKMIAKLVPNLIVNDNNTNTVVSSKEQIIENIQNNLPPDPNATIEAQINAYDNMIKKYQAYNSADGYAINYPYDPYTVQQYQNNMTL